MATLKDEFDNANPNSLADAFRKTGFGGYMQGQGPQALRKKDPAASSSVLATLESIALPDAGKASSIQRAYARAGTGTLGELTVVAANVTPAAGQCAVAPNGDLVFLAADAYTSVDVDFQPSRGDAFTLPELPVATHVLTIPAQFTSKGVLYLVEANATAGTSTGKKIILAPGAGAPAAGQARLNLAKGTVTFAVADAVTKAVLKITACTANDLGDALASAAFSA